MSLRYFVGADFSCSVTLSYVACVFMVFAIDCFLGTPK